MLQHGDDKLPFSSLFTFSKTINRCFLGKIGGSILMREHPS